MQALDEKVGRVMFLPWILPFLRLTGITQYAFHSYAWLAAGLFALYTMETSSWFDLVFATLLILMCVAFVVQAGLNPNKPAKPNGLLRQIFLIFAGLSTLRAALGVSPWSGLAVDLIILSAEYALLIDKVPPRRRKPAKAPA